MKKKISVSLAIVALALCCAVGGTIAWLTATTEKVVNTFTYGDINITLNETTGTEYKMVPGNTISKDPVVTVEGGSEACWLFVKVEESSNFDQFMKYTVDSGWTALDDETGVYYRVVSASTTDQVFNVLTDNQVTVLDTVTKEKFNDLTDATMPKLSFTAFAVQRENIDTVTDAWAKVSA